MEDPEVDRTQGREEASIERVLGAVDDHVRVRNLGDRPVQAIDRIEVIAVPLSQPLGMTGPKQGFDAGPEAQQFALGGTQSVNIGPVTIERGLGQHLTPERAPAERPAATALPVFDETSRPYVADLARRDGTGRGCESPGDERAPRPPGSSAYRTGSFSGTGRFGQDEALLASRQPGCHGECRHVPEKNELRHQIAGEAPHDVCREDPGITACQCVG